MFLLFDRIRREVSKSLAKRGVPGTLKFGLVLIATRLRELVSGKRVSGRRTESVEPFDERYGVDTAGIVRLGELRIASDNWIYGQQYQPIGTPDFQSLLAPTGIDIASATFIDLGSGKGRAILLAMQLPFKRVVGVEFSKELNTIAERNLRVFPEGDRRCHDVSLCSGDAAQFVFPEGPLVIYLYNPFEAPVMRQVVANVAATYCADPRPIVILYFTPLHAGLWGGLDFLSR